MGTLSEVFSYKLQGTWATRTRGPSGDSDDDDDDDKTRVHTPSLPTVCRAALLAPSAVSQ